MENSNDFQRVLSELWPHFNQVNWRKAAVYANCTYNIMKPVEPFINCQKLCPINTFKRIIWYHSMENYRDGINEGLK